MPSGVLRYHVRYLQFGYSNDVRVQSRTRDLTVLSSTVNRSEGGKSNTGEIEHVGFTGSAKLSELIDTFLLQADSRTSVVVFNSFGNRMTDRIEKGDNIFTIHIPANLVSFYASSCFAI
jgi:hypothetical protein